MKKLLNTLYVTSENSYLSLDGENIVVFEENDRNWALALTQSGGNRFFWLQGDKSCSYGSVCGEKYFSLLYDATGEIFGSCYRKNKR